MISEVDHIGVAVRSIEEALEFYQVCLGLECREILDIPERKVRAAMINSGNLCIELIEPLNEDSPISKFLSKKGEGIHHIAFKVPSIEDAINQLTARGVELVNTVPQEGAHGRKVVFLAPQSCHGVLIELCEAQGRV